MSEQRKLRPIYDALDAHNPKAGLKLCDAALKKGGSPLIRALKAVALDRLRRSDEAIALVRETAKTLAPPVDDHLLSTMLIVFKNNGLAHEMTAVYEAAHKAEPESEELAGVLFAAYLRASEFAKAQQLAMRLYKGPGEDAAEKVYWAVTCNLLQVDCMGPPRQPSRHYEDEAPPPEASKHLQLAAAMLGRAASSGKLTAAAHLRLYLAVCRRQRDRVTALKLLSDHGGLLQNAEEVERLRAELLEASGKHAEAHACHATILATHAHDDWAAWRGLLRCAVTCGADGGADGGDSGSGLKAVAALQAELAAKHPKSRAPRLAAVVLALLQSDGPAACAMLCASSHAPAVTCAAASSMDDAPDAHAVSSLAASLAAAVDLTEAAAEESNGGGGDGVSASVSALIAQLHSYFEAFGEKPACTLDTLPALASLSRVSKGGPAAQAALLSQLEAQHSLSPASAPSPPSLSWLRRYITLSQWRLGCGALSSLPLAERLRIASEWMTVYNTHAPLSSELDKRERGHADTLPLLAAQLLVGAHTADWFADRHGVVARDPKRVLSAALCLRMALDASPHNFQLALALHQCYLCLGAPASAHSLHRDLNLKYIQNDSLGYLAMPAYLTLGATEQASHALVDAKRFASSGLSEMAESLSLAFSSSSYPQALEFVAFRRSLEASWWREAVGVMHGLSDLKTSCASAAEVVSSLATLPCVTANSGNSAAVASSSAANSGSAGGGGSGVGNGGRLSTAAAVRALPDPTDVDVFEEHLPHASMASYVDGLREAWLPRRATLLRAVYQAVLATPKAPNTAASAALTGATEALAVLVGGAGTGGATGVSGGTTGGGDGTGTAEDWAPLLAMLRLSVLLAPPPKGDGNDTGATTAAEEPDVAAIVAACEVVGKATLHALKAPLAPLATPAGYPVSALAPLAFVTTIGVPVLCVLSQRWASLLPAKRRRKGGGGGAEGEGGGAEATEPPAAADPRSVLRGMLDSVAAALGDVEAILKAAGRRPESCTLLETQQEEWARLVGEAPAAVAARERLLTDLTAANKTELNALFAGARHAAAALKQVAKNY